MGKPKLNVYVLTMEYYDDDLEKDTEEIIGIFFSKSHAETQFNWMFGLFVSDGIKFRKEGKGYWSYDDPFPGIHGASIKKYRVDQRVAGIEHTALEVVIAKVRKDATSPKRDFSWLTSPTYEEYLTGKTAP